MPSTGLRKNAERVSKRTVLIRLEKRDFDASNMLTSSITSCTSQKQILCFTALVPCTGPKGDHS